jgi:hypothetical protein
MSNGRHSKDHCGPPPSPPQAIRGIETFGRLDDPPEKPTAHGEGTDPRYPSPRRLRRILAFVSDWLLHAGPMVAVFVLLAHSPVLAGKLPQARLWAFLSWPLLSFLDRTVVQGVFHATIGKLLFGLVAIRFEDGRYPAFGRLVKVWFVGLIFSILLIADLFGNGGGGGDDWDFRFLPVVRRRDIKHL